MTRHWRAQAATCLYGHPFPEHLYIDRRGHACCRACWRAAWIPAMPDEVAIDRAVMGDPPERLTPRERLAAVQQLDAKGLSAQQIARRVRRTRRAKCPICTTSQLVNHDNRLRRHGAPGNACAGSGWTITPAA
jgi:hypothetical protein